MKFQHERYIIYICIILVAYSECHDHKYSREVNQPDSIDLRPISLKHLDRPFRLSKFNLLWSKAVLRLTEEKLKSIFGELKILDKEELAWKHAQREDTDGLIRAKFRDKLLLIMRNYSLLDFVNTVDDQVKHYPFKALNEATDKHINTEMFKDKKLNKLWQKAERSGFTNQELQVLQQEFKHHQDKIDQYYSLLHDVRSDNRDDGDENSIDDGLDRFNRIDISENGANRRDYIDKANLLRNTHNSLKTGYEYLEKKAAQGAVGGDFIEPKVQGLWRAVNDGNFTADEIKSLYTELKHYENRLLKLRHMQVEAALNEEAHKKKAELLNTKPNGKKLLDDNIKKATKKVEKLHLDLESRIMEKHMEL